MYVGLKKQIKAAVKQEVIGYLEKCNIEKMSELNAKVIQMAKKRIASRLGCYQTEVFFVNEPPNLEFTAFADKATGIINEHYGKYVDISNSVRNVPLNLHELPIEVALISPSEIGAIEGTYCIIIKKASEVQIPTESKNIISPISIGRVIFDECNTSALAVNTAQLRAITDYIITTMSSINGLEIVTGNRLCNTVCFSIDGDREAFAALMKIYNIELGEAPDGTDNRITISLDSSAKVTDASKIYRSTRLVLHRLSRTRKK